MELSKRLQAVADLVTPGLRIADIGTDHAYVPVYLLSEGKNPSGIAMDINVGPLERARKHIGELLTDGELKTRLSDGMKELKTGEVQCAVIAGMGGGLVMKILSESREIADSLQECVLQPQSELEKVRTFLLKEGFFIIQEDMVKEDGKYYPMMKVLPNQKEKCQQESWTTEELRFGKRLLEQKHPVLLEYLRREQKIYEEILRRLEGEDSERIRERKKKIAEELEVIRNVFLRMRQE